MWCYNIEIFIKTTRVRFLATILTMPLGLLLFGQNDSDNIKYGLYGSYADPSWFQELTIYENGKFIFYDKVELGNSGEYIVKWRMDGTILVLYGFKNDKLKPIPTRYIVKKNSLCLFGKAEVCLGFKNEE